MVEIPNAVELELPGKCGLDKTALLTIIVTSDPNQGFSQPNVFSPNIEKKNIKVDGSDAVETTKGVPSAVGAEQIGIKKDDLYYIIQGEPCFTVTSRKVIDTLTFSK